MVVLGSLTLRHLVVRDVGNLAEQGGEFIFRSVHILLELFVLSLQCSHLLFGLLSLVLLALLHKCTNLCGKLFSLLLGLVELLLCLAATLVNGENIVDSFPGTSEVLFLQTAYHAVSFLCNEL